MKIIGGLACFFVFSIFAHDRVLLITHAYNQPDFIKMQVKTFKKFLKDEYEFVVFNDAATDAMAKEIQDVCLLCCIRCIRVPQEIHDRPYLKRLPDEPYHRPNIRHVNCCQYSLDVLGFDFDGIVGFIDSDMFLIRPLSINKEMQGYDILSAGRETEKNIIYFWPGLCFLRMNILPDKRTLSFNCGKIMDCSVDSGGYSYYYLQAHPAIKYKWIYEIWGGQHLFCPDRFIPTHMINLNASYNERITRYKELGFNEREIIFLLKKPDTIEFLLNNSVLHYRAGTNYDNQSRVYNNNKKKLVEDFLEETLQSE